MKKNGHRNEWKYSDFESFCLASWFVLLKRLAFGIAKDICKLKTIYGACNIWKLTAYESIEENAAFQCVVDGQLTDVGHNRYAIISSVSLWSTFWRGSYNIILKTLM